MFSATPAYTSILPYTVNRFPETDKAFICTAYSVFRNTIDTPISRATKILTIRYYRRHSVCLYGYTPSLCVFYFALTVQLKGVHFAMEFLTKNQKRLLMTGDGKIESNWDGGFISAEGKDVIVIGVCCFCARYSEEMSAMQIIRSRFVGKQEYEIRCKLGETNVTV